MLRNSHEAPYDPQRRREKMYPVVCTVLRTVSLSRNHLTINYHSVCGKHAIAGTRTTVPAVSENVKRANDRP